MKTMYFYENYYYFNGRLEKGQRVVGRMPDKGEIVLTDVEMYVFPDKVSEIGLVDKSCIITKPNLKKFLNGETVTVRDKEERTKDKAVIKQISEGEYEELRDIYDNINDALEEYNQRMLTTF